SVEGEQMSTGHHDIGVGFLSDFASGIGRRTTRNQCPCGTEWHALVPQAFLIIRRANITITEARTLAIECDRGEHAVPFEEMIEHCATDLPHAGSVPVHGADETFGQLALYLIDSII